MAIKFLYEFVVIENYNFYSKLRSMQSKRKTNSILHAGYVLSPIVEPPYNYLRERTSRPSRSLNLKVEKI